MVLTTGNAYLLVISDLATVDSIRAQVKTAETLYQQDVDRGKQGVIASIDVLRSNVELQTQQQRLIAAENQLSIDKLTLARVIGLPNGQEFQLTDSVPYAPLDEMTLDAGAAASAFDAPRLPQREVAGSSSGTYPRGGPCGELSLLICRHELRRHRQPEFRDFTRDAFICRRAECTNLSREPSASR